jgi:aminoglycoside phosphotransferase (APT) family kinase protein
VRIGAPGRDYPWAWSVCPWFHGAMAADVALAEPQREAERLGAFVEALHRAAPADAPTNVALRGRPLAELSDRFDLHLARDVVPDARAADERWRELTAVEPWRGPATWVHGDLHTANVLVDRGAICAVIDFGDVTAGDPAVDLAIAWMLFDGDHREVFRSCAGAADDDALWLRAEGWALYFAVVYLANSADNPRFTRIGRDLLATVLPPANS